METNPDNTQLDRPKPIRIGRLEFGANLFIQILIWLLLLTMVNYWSVRHYWRFDWGLNTDLQLSPQTKSLLTSLQKPARAIVYFSGVNPEAEDAAVKLLGEYEHASNGKLTIENVVPDLNRARAIELATKYKFGNSGRSESLVIFDYDGRHKFVQAQDMAEMERMTPQQEQAYMMEAMRAQQEGREAPPPPHLRMLAFKGEQLMTSALLEVTEPKQNKVYFLTGHGEIDYAAVNEPEGRSLDEMKALLTRQNVLHSELRLAEREKIPDDANALYILGPRLDFSERDLQILTEYWDRKGRIFITTGPTQGRMKKFNAWLAERGVEPQDDFVVRVMQNLAGKKAPISVGIVMATPILPGLDNTTIQVQYPFQSLKVDQKGAAAAQIQITNLIVAPQEFWGETVPFTSEDLPRFDKDVDHAEPLILGVAIEKGAASDVKLDTARMVVLGAPELLSDAGIQLADDIARDLASNASNWTLGRDNLINIPPKTAEAQRSFSLTPDQTGIIAMWVMLLIPLIVAVFGLYHLWWRNGRNLFLLTAWMAGIFLGLVALFYLLLYVLGHEGAKTVPKGLIIALAGAAALGALAVWMHIVEEQKRVKLLVTKK
jgi:ABC-type uncharacterized transport system